MAMQTMELEPDAFWRMVTQENLKVAGPSAGYQWTGKQGKNGWETYKVRAQPIGWLYQARRVATQGNAAGGAIVIDIALPTGVTARLLWCLLVNSGTNSAIIEVLDEDNALHCRLLNIASGAATIASVPRNYTAITTEAIVTSQGMMIGPGCKLTARQAGAGIQADTATISVGLMLSAEITPTWDKSRSTNQADVTLAASTISAANTLQAVYL